MLKKLAKVLREYKKPTIITPILMIGEVSCECIIPLLTKELINSIQRGSEMGPILKYGLLLFAMAMCSLAFGVLSGWFGATASAGFAKNLRKDLFYRIQDFSFTNIDKFSSSSLVTRLTTDIANVQQAFMMIIRVAVRAPLMLIVAFFMSFKVGGSLAWIFAAIIPLLGIFLFGGFEFPSSGEMISGVISAFVASILLVIAGFIVIALIKILQNLMALQKKNR